MSNLSTLDLTRCAIIAAKAARLLAGVQFHAAAQPGRPASASTGPVAGLNGGMLLNIGGEAGWLKDFDR
ncbi:hypothetical protein [Paludibaculum fermentans]|uniref:hypothetical protein n=1 Tax=Paludibaculum fermentans TaxID=1473598 RepID=UPI003EBB4832